MEQFRQVGEVLGSLKALMVLKDDIQINQRQCCLLLDMFTLAFLVISEEIRLYLKAEERNTKWKALEQPLKELQRVFREGEIYVKQCLDNRDWWSKAINFHHNKDCVEYHIHNLLCCFPGVVEAIESAGEISGLDPDEMQRRRVALARKYDKEWNDPKLFQLRFGKEYLVPREICSRFESAWKEDRWLLVEALREKKRLGSVVLTKNEQCLVDMLLKKLNGSEPGSEKQLFPTSILLRGKDYQVRRRLGGGSEYKEIQWLGDSFAVRHFFGEIESLNTEISTLLSLSHPNILQYHCGFFDEEKKEFYLVMELMSKDLSVYIKENCGSRRRLLFSIPVVVDLMLQIARGMEFLHSRKIYHGDLNPSNIFLKARSSAESYFHVKVSGFGLTDVRSRASRKAQSPPPPPPPSQNGSSTATATSPTLQIQNMPHFIWHAPEVLAEQEQQSSMLKHTEKADVYSFGMLCFELLTGKVPFEDSHLQGDTMARNIRAGGRPLFPSGSPKYLVNLTKRCWHTNPSQRPSFSSICRILRYIKKFLVMNPEIVESFQSPLADYYDIEAGFVKKFVGEGNSDMPSVSQIPFQMFAYRIAEKDKAIMSNKDKQWDLSSDASSLDLMAPAANNDSRSVCSDVKSVCFDLRSVYSEVPGKRISNFDMRSVCSEAPNKNLIRSITRRPLLHSKVPEKNSDTKSERNVTPEKRIPSSDTRSVCSRNSDKKTVVIKKTTDVKVEKDSGKIEIRSAKTAPKTRPSRPARSSATAQSPSGRSSGPPESLRKWSSKMRQNSLSPSAICPGSPSRRKFSSSVSGSKFPGSPSRQKVPANLSGSESPGSPRRRRFPVNQSGSESPGSPSRPKAPNNISGFECPGSPSRRKLPINKSGFECPGSPSRLRASVNVSGSESPESPSRLKTAISLPSSYAESPGSPSRLKMAVSLSSPDIVRRIDVPGSGIA